MTFNSFGYLFLFLPLAWAGYFLLGRISRSSAWPKLWLIASSLVFYASARVDHLLLLLGSAAFNYWMAHLLVARPPGNGQEPRGAAKNILIFGITANIGFLALFKYAGFFVLNLNSVAGTHIPLPHVAFPLGISFFTIQQITFLVDCYEGLVENHNALDHMTFISMFPYVTMGPIVRWKDVVPQLNALGAARVNADNCAVGLYVFAIGLFKKAVLADTFFRWADAGFAYSSPLSFAGGWISAIAFTLQLYFDFSGYTDMALGSAKMLNIQLPQNFDAPFRTQSIGEFWRAWHITLTNFITTYLYTPIVRSFKKLTFPKAMFATFISMVIAGFWHGASWNFLIFGALHGAALVTHQWWKKRKTPLPAPLAWAVTFAFVFSAMVFFRAPDVPQALRMLTSMYTPGFTQFFSYEPWSGIDRVEQLTGLLWMAVGAAVLARGKSSLQLQKSFQPSMPRVAFASVLLLIGLIYANGVVSRSFVYRDF